MTIKARTILFVAVLVASAIACYMLIRPWLHFLSESEFASLTYMMPLLSAVLILRSRSEIFSKIDTSRAGAILAAAGILLFVVSGFKSAGLNAADILSAKILALVVLWIGAFVGFYGVESGRKALFPLLMLLFMVPIPEVMLSKIIHALQQGSGEGVAILFKLTGTPYHREGLAFMLPKTTIEIAPQCSSIRSSLALLIGCLLAGHLMLRTVSRKFILILVAIPMAMLKNAIRIVTLSLLAIHVDMGYLVGGDLHRRGGIVFFALTLLLLFPVLWALRKSEKAATN